MGKEKAGDSEEIRITSAYDSKEIITSGNREMDKKMGGGIPVGSLTLIEGSNDTGKSVLTQQLMWGGLQQGFTFATYTTENTIKSLLKQMDSLSLDISDYFVFGKLKMYPIHMEGIKWANDVPFLDYITADVKAKHSEVILIDSLTVFVSDASDNDVLNFFASCKNICDSGKTILITAHTFAFGEEVLTRVRSICDAHLSLRKEEVGDRLLRTMEVAKIRGAQRTTGNVIAFEVEPAFGLRIIPVSRTKA
ncbi:MAG: flagellar accessory protein FlaH [Methanophagales archaeon]|nr:flagellar accessory protein FlaH [Methanophagales archaeon]